MLTLQQTWSSVMAHTPCLPASEVAIAEALGCVLAEPILADRDLPPADRAAKDGFAVRAADLRNAPITLPVTGEVAAGSPAQPPVAEGACARIFTGANLPPGADTVAMIEGTREAGPGRVTFTVGESVGAHILRRGENARQGSELVPAGCVLGAIHIGLAASAGRTTLRAFRKPRVSLVTTGR
jgi:molybdopterin molybdotransferase